MSDHTHSLWVQDLSVSYYLRRRTIRAVREVGLRIGAPERFGLVGESGCGKSTLATAAMGLIRPPGRVDSGTISIGENDILSRTERGRRRMRWSEIAMVPQGAMNSLNPVIRIREQFTDTLVDHGATPSGNGAGRELIDEALVRVGLSPDVAGSYPHELSGGMKQRVCIALALLLGPRFVIADEPTSALDLITARSIMDLLVSEQIDNGTGLLIIGHDIALIATAVDRIGVMYAGTLVELGPVGDVYAEPLHPYTNMLISSLPSIRERRISVDDAAGSTPHVPHQGCPFAPRCSYRMPVCEQEIPPLVSMGNGRQVACHLYGDTGEEDGNGTST